MRSLLDTSSSLVTFALRVSQSVRRSVLGMMYCLRSR